MTGGRKPAHLRRRGATPLERIAAERESLARADRLRPAVTPPADNSGKPQEIDL